MTFPCSLSKGLRSLKVHFRAVNGMTKDISELIYILVASLSGWLVLSAHGTGPVAAPTDYR